MPRKPNPKSKVDINKVQPISCDLIDPPKLDMRITHNQERITDLARSIKAKGLLQPILLQERGSRYEIIFGHRRFLAHQHLKEPTIKAIVVKWKTQEIISARAQENLEREDVTPFEEARYVQAMQQKLKCSQKQMARLLARSESWISQRLAVATYPEMLLDALQTNEISFSVARLLNNIKDPESLRIYLRSAAENGATPRVVEGWVRSWQAANSDIDKDEATYLPDNIEQQAAPATNICFFCEEPHQYSNLISIWLCKSDANLIRQIKADMSLQSEQAQE